MLTTIKPEVPDAAQLNATSAAKALGVGVRTLYNYANNGAIRCGRHKHNKRMFFTGRELKRFWQATL